MIRYSLLFLITALLSLGFVSARAQTAKPAATTKGAVSFHRDVLPIFQTACIGCHNAQSPASGLSLASYAELMKGGRSGVPLAPGKGAESRLVQMLAGTVKPQMPPGGMLKSSDIETIRRWIDAGAKQDAQTIEKVEKTPGKRLALNATGSTSTLKATYRPLGALRPVNTPVNALAFSPDGKTLAVGTYQRVLFCDAVTRQIVRTWSGHADAVRSLAFTADGKWLAAGGGSPGAFGEVRLWDVAMGREASVFSDHADVVNALAFSPNGKTLVTGSADKSLKVWAVTTGKLLQTLRDHADSILGLAYHPNGKYLASCSADKSVKIWDTTSWRRLYSIGAHDDIVTDVEFSPNGNQLLTSSADHSAKVWNFGPENSGEARRLDGHGHTVWAATLASDGKLAATASADKTVKLWNFDNGGVRATLTDPQDWVYAVRFSPDHKRLAAGTWNGAIYLWNVETLKPEGILYTLSAPAISAAAPPKTAHAIPSKN